MFFGLGDNEEAVKATVRWPSGAVQTFERLPADHRFAIEEGSDSPEATAFSAARVAEPSPVSAASDTLPTEVQTWLVEPLRAPDFSLPDVAGSRQTLASFKGDFTLLTFWSTGSPVSLIQLKQFQRDLSRAAGKRPRIVAINIDEPAGMVAARGFADQNRFGFPVLFATEETAGIYNLIYRHMFDRRRELPVPASFLIDPEGMIVRVYQGSVALEMLIGDLKAVPANAEARMRKALPFPGHLVQAAFTRNDFTYGVAMFQHGYLDQAAASFEQVIAAKPDNADAYYNLGTLNLRRNNFEEARRCLEQTLKLRADYPEAWNNLGMMAAQQGRAEDAIRNFEQSLALRPHYAIALLNLGNVYRRQHAYDKAQDCLAQALGLQPDDPEINYSMGLLHAQQNDVPTALRYLRRALELRPDYPEAINNLGVLFVRQQDYTQAEVQFKNGIRSAPAYDQSYINLARLYALQGDKQKARETLEGLLHLQPENPAAKQALEVLQ